MARIAALSGAGSFAQAVTTWDKSGQDVILFREAIREASLESPMFAMDFVGFESPSLRRFHKNTFNKGVIHLCSV